MPTKPTRIPSWATDATFTSGPKINEPTKVQPSAGQAAQGFVPGPQGFMAGFANDQLNLISDGWIAWLADTKADAIDNIAGGMFGDGSDGDVTITSGTTTLSRDMYYNDLTVTDTGVLDTNGYRVFVKGTCTVQSGGVIRHNGAAASTATQGAGAAIGSIGGGSAGGAGVINSTANGNDGVSLEPDAGNFIAGAIGGAGGAGGDSGDGQTGGAGGTCTPPTADFGGWRHLDAALGYLRGGPNLSGGILLGGTGGGSGGNVDGGGTGAGGGGGGVIVLFAAYLDNAGTIEANGGDGGDADPNDSSGSGGGGGGGGGAVFIVTRGRTGTGTIEAAGGAGGTGVEGGENGEAGSPGVVIELTV